MELAFHAWLRERLPPVESGLGVGDDAASIALARPEIVATSDLLIDGVHFLSTEHTPEQIGRKALAVNLSDLAAMAARPVGATVSIALPRQEGSLEYAKRLIEGMLPISGEFRCPIVGGDTNTGPGPLTISVTALGETTEHSLVRRDGARPGDRLLVTGRLGGSLAGGHLDFHPRVEEALALNAEYELHAMIDLSDGLALDLQRLAEASDAGAELDCGSIPVSEQAREMAAGTSLTPAEHALSDGEDFELLIAAPPESADRMLANPPECGITGVGSVTSTRGLWLLNRSGAREPLRARGYEHR